MDITVLTIKTKLTKTLKLLRHQEWVITHSRSVTAEKRWHLGVP